MYAHMADSPLEPWPSSYPDPGAVLMLAVFRIAFARSSVSSWWHSFFSSSWWARDMVVWTVKLGGSWLETRRALAPNMCDASRSVAVDASVSRSTPARAQFSPCHPSV